jgi:hypothetical protein
VDVSQYIAGCTVYALWHLLVALDWIERQPMERFLPILLVALIAVVAVMNWRLSAKK